MNTWLIRIIIIVYSISFTFHIVQAADNEEALKEFKDGYALYSNGKYKEAAIPLAKAAKLGLDTYTLNFSLGLSYYAQGLVSNAITFLSKASKYNPDAQSYLKIINAQIALYSNPADTKSIETKAQGQFELGFFAKSKSNYELTGNTKAVEACAIALATSKEIVQSRELSLAAKFKEALALLTDKLFESVKKTSNNNLAAQFLFAKGYALEGLSRYKEAKEAYTMVATVAKGNQLLQLDANIALSTLKYRLGNFEENYNDLLKLGLTIEKLGDYEKTASINLNIGAVLVKMGYMVEKDASKSAFPKAEEHYNKAVAFFDLLSDTYNMVVANNNLANLYRFTGRNSEALSLYKKAVDIATSAKEDEGLSIAKGNLGYYYLLNNQLKEAVKELEEAQKIAERSENRWYEALVNSELGIILDATDQSNRGLAYGELALVYFQDLESSSGKVEGFNIISRIYRRRGEVRQSLYYAEKAVSIAKDIKDFTGMAFAKAEYGLALAKSGDSKGQTLIKEALALSDLIGHKELKAYIERESKK